MNYKVSPVQRDLYIECMINNEANKKYSLNMIYSINLKEEKTVKEILGSICTVINNQPLMLATPIVNKSKILLRPGDEFKIEEIAIGECFNNLDDDEIFKKPFDVVNNKRLFNLKLVKDTNNKYYLLMAIHHFSFDFYSAISFSQQVVDSINGELNISKDDLIDEMYLTNNKFSEKGCLERYQKRFLNRLSIINEQNQKAFKTSSKVRKIEIIDNVDIDKSINNNYRSALLIAAFAYSYIKYTNNDHVIVGVPVPNRVKGNKNLICCLVTMYPVVILKEWTLEECRNKVYKQLVNNLKMQFFDFNKQFPNLFIAAKNQ